MDGSDKEQFKKDWITTLASTSGIMLTVALMVLTVLYTSSSISIAAWQKFLISTSIVGASISLMICSVYALKALGTLIVAASKREAAATQEDVKKSEEKTAAQARKAQAGFIAGLSFLIAAIVLSLFFLSWPFFAEMYNHVSN